MQTMSLGWGDDIVKSIYIFFFSKNEDDGLNPEVDSEGKLFSTFAFKACFRPIEPAFPAATIPSRIPACSFRAGHGPLPCDRRGIPPWMPSIYLFPRGKRRGMSEIGQEYFAAESRLMGWTKRFFPGKTIYRPAAS